MKSLMIGAATAIALLAGPAFAEGSIADSPAATSAGVNNAVKNPPCVPGTNDVACGDVTSGSSSSSGSWNSGSGSSTTGTGWTGNASSGMGNPSGTGGAQTTPGMADTPPSTSGSGSGGSRGTAK